MAQIYYIYSSQERSIISSQLVAMHVCNIVNIWLSSAIPVRTFLTFYLVFLCGKYRD